MVTKSDITKRQEQLLDELNNCDDELSGQELHRQLMDNGKSMGLTTVYRNLQILIKHGLIRSDIYQMEKFFILPLIEIFII